MAEFDRWAPYYDLIHKGLPGEAEFYVGHAARIAGTTLELGCGTGRICIPMAMSGAEVTGLDISAKMLAVCREKLKRVGKIPGALTLIRGDMRAFDLQKRFDFIAIPYRTFMHLLTPADQLACLTCVRRHLARDGTFVLNLWAARPSAIARFVGNPVFEEFQLAGRYPLARGANLVHHHAVRYDEFRQLIIERHRLQELDSRGRLKHEEHLSLTRASVTPREMEHLLHRGGFEIETVWGDFYGTSFGPASTEMIWFLHCGRKRRSGSPQARSSGPKGAGFS